MKTSYEQIEKMTESLVKAYSDFNYMTRDAMNAALQSMTAITKGCEELCDSANALVRKTIENGAQMVRSTMNARDINELVDLQSGFIRNAFDSILSEMNNMSLLSSRIAKQASEPVAQHMNAAITKLSLVKAA